MGHKSLSNCRLKLILNPIAGGGYGLKILPHVLRCLERRGLEVEVFRTQKKGDACEAARNSLDYEAIATMGGDGTFNEVINGAIGNDVPLGLIPLGTANVLARELRIPLDPIQAAHVIARGNTRRIDAGKADSRHFFLMAGIGFDAEVVKVLEANRKGNISMAAYAIPILKAMWNYKFPALDVEVDGKLIAEGAGFVFVSNTRRYTGPFVITNRARVDDGLLDIFIFPGRDYLKLLKYTAGILFWIADRIQEVKYLQGREIRVSSADEVSYQLDGDLGGPLPARFQVVPGALNIIVPG
ncbi:MAG: diacylglycerol kinase family lipid kinase [Planctomycetes bacterium]|nr:diacylglycerol kinase family lipid kinase [Planctomycetota bacterium]